MENQPIELSQENKRGSQSIQIAQQNNYYGMDYKEIQELCHNLLKDELKLYKEEAEKLLKKGMSIF